MCPYSIIWHVHANLNPLRALAQYSRAFNALVQCSCALNVFIQLLRTFNALVLRLRALNLLTQHAMNMRVLLQIYRGTYKCACLTVNLHVSCTVNSNS